MLKKIKCKYCGSTNLIRKGYSGWNRNIKIFCKDCKRTFVLMRKYVPT